MNPSTKSLSCLYCGGTEYLGKNSKGVIHCSLCCKENNDETGLQCEPLPITQRGNSS